MCVFRVCPYGAYMTTYGPCMIIYVYIYKNNILNILI